MYFYTAYGLAIDSPLELELQARDALCSTDLTISETKVSSAGLDDPLMSQALAQAKPGAVWFDAPDIARFLITDGSKIQYQPYPGADEQSIVLYLMGSAIGAALHQRGYLVLHANAVNVDGRAVLMAGHSGAGKSTSAAVFHQRGYDVIGDDVIAIDPNGNVIGGPPRIKLWQDALENLDISHAELDRIRLQINKFNFPLEQRALTEPIPIAAVYILRAANENEDFDFHALTGIDKFNHLKAHTYRSVYVDGLGLKGQHLALCGKIAGNVPMAKIIRPNNRFNANELVDRLLEDYHARAAPCVPA